MFDISITEILLVATVAVIFIGPKEFPLVVRSVAKFVMQCKRMWHEVKLTMREVARESGLDDIKRELEDEYTRDMTMIKGDDGNYYEAYDMGDLALDEVIDVAANSPTPLAGGAGGGSVKHADASAELIDPPLPSTSRSPSPPQAGRIKDKEASHD